MFSNDVKHKMKSGKGPGLDGFPIECLKKGYMTVRMVSETVGQMYRYGRSTHGLAWCMYTAPV